MVRERFVLGLMASCLLAACMVEPTYYPPPATAGSTGAAPPAGYAAQPGQAQPAYAQPAYAQPGAPIEAGCSYTGRNIEGGVGGVFQVACPPGCEHVGGLWGSDVYTADSAICRAGIHAGAISGAGGVVTLRLDPGRPAYRGSTRNGIQSGDYGSYNMSYTVFLPTAPQQGAAVPAAAEVAGPDPAAAPPAPVSAQVIEAGCSFSASQIRDAVGTAHRVSCPPGCERSGGLWGTDVYTSDSGICRAAIHAGLISPQGGAVTVILEPGRPAYRGSSRYGIHSADYGSYAASFRLAR